MDNLFFLKAKCVKTKQTFYIRFDLAAGGVWCQTYGVKSIPVSSGGGPVSSMNINVGEADIGPQYRCPHCGNTGYVKCGRCGKLTCKTSGDNSFSCAHCGNSGEINGYISNIDGKSGSGQ